MISSIIGIIKKYFKEKIKYSNRYISLKLYKYLNSLNYFFIFFIIFYFLSRFYSVESVIIDYLGIFIFSIIAIKSFVNF